MKCGDVLLVDELNLAEDAVLERLNSVLEPGRTLTLAEKGGGGAAGAEVVVAHPAFRVVATMNPGAVRCAVRCWCGVVLLGVKRQS